MALAVSRHGKESLKKASGQFIPGFEWDVTRGNTCKGETKSVYASMLDFRVSMESNPQILGEYWPTQLEKISSHGFEGTALTASRAVARLIYAPLASLRNILIQCCSFSSGKWTKFDKKLPAVPT
ncbi:hypothetical protein OIU74_009109 [Salix koriyanagi]|uniref:Uncharacterized protein n=1 Tax=Salix koriyanagi TaxID=2511006 RepID=A0A9Q0TRK7_9ROSI|nr:hypothetical protein OIU74_009109 [Salix koriyanagi]